MIKLVLGFFDLWAWLLRRLGVNYEQFRAVLSVKLTLDGRRRFTAVQMRSSKASSNAFVTGLAMNVFMGLMVALVLAAAAPMVGMTLVHSLIMALMALGLIADYSSVLLDTTDNQVLQPRPIDSRTILAARLAHITTYIVLLAMSLAAASFVVGALRFGPAFVAVFALTLVASILLVVGCVNALYLLALRMMDAEKLRDIILIFQVAMTVLVIGGYQIMPRLMDIKPLATWNLTDSKWIYVLPPAWFAAPVDLLLGRVDTPRIVLSAIGVVIPVAAMLAVLLLSKGYKRALARLDAAPAATAPPGDHATGRQSSISPWLARRPVERAAFDFLWVLAGRDRQFKLRTYPNVVMVLVFGAIMALSHSDNLRTALHTLPQSRKYILMLYICCALAPTSYFQMRYSDRFEAAWIYRALPLARPGEVLMAALKVVLVRLALPSFLLVTAVTLLVWGFRIVPDIVLAGCSLLLICGIQALSLNVRLPFAEPFAVMDSSGRTARVLFYMMTSVMLGGIHFALSFVPFGVSIAIPFVAVAAWLVLRAYGEVSWDRLLADQRRRMARAAAGPRAGAKVPAD